MENTEFVERRKHQRFQIPTGSFVALGPDDTILGRIIDISLSGVAFHYMGDTLCFRPKDESYLDIHLTEGDLSLKKVPVETVSDDEISDVVSSKLVSVQFGQLTHHQISQLEHFIEDYAIGEA
jgi:c-di-GMP-binding flagellar brake protein YcgR